MSEIGRPKFWFLQEHINAVEQMIRADEIQIALTMLDQVPAWYRTNRPKELEEIRRKLYQGLYDPMQYGNDDEEASCTREFGENQFVNGYMHPRAEIITGILDKLNNEGKTPWIFDLGCSHGNLPLGLMKHTNLAFSYLGKSLNHRAAEKIKDWIGVRWSERPRPGQHTILYNTEVIEHAMNPMDIVQSAYKIGVDFDTIVLSVPLGCLGGGLENWDSRPLGHVRGWTVEEFYAFARENFPGYEWTITVAPSMVLVGERVK